METVWRVICLFNGSRLGEVAEHKTLIEVQTLNLDKMSNEKQNGNFAKPMLAVVLIFGRYLVAFGFGMLPIIIGLESDWYVIPLVVLNFVMQFGLATFQMLPYFKQVSRHYR